MKKISILGTFLVATFFLSGCSLGTSSIQPTKTSPTAKATFLKTVDGGKIWEAKMKINDTKTIASINVLTIAADPFDNNIIYLGSEKDGIFVSRDGAETWEQVAFPEKVYGIAIDHATRDVMYASGVLNGRAKIFKRIGVESEWKEIYTEPAEGTTISSLAMDKFNANIIYAGTSSGVIFKTTDGGNTWNNLYDAEAPVISIAFDSANANIVYFGVFQRAILKTSNGGTQIENITNKISALDNNQNVFSVISDPYFSGTLYVGLGNGIVKSSDRGENWTQLNILGSSKNFPIKALAINPQNSSEIMYVSGKAIYKSTDGGVQWSTFQLDASKDVSKLVYNKDNPTIVYAGLRSF